MNENETIEESDTTDVSFGKGVAMIAGASAVIITASVATVAISIVVAESVQLGIDTLREKRAERKAAKQKKTEV